MELQFNIVTWSSLAYNFFSALSAHPFRSISVTKDPSSVRTARLQLWTPVWLKEGSMSPLPLGCSCTARWGHPSAASVGTLIVYDVIFMEKKAPRGRIKGKDFDVMSKAVDWVMGSCTLEQSGMGFFSIFCTGGHVCLKSKCVIFQVGLALLTYYVPLCYYFNAIWLFRK